MNQIELLDVESIPIGVAVLYEELAIRRHASEGSIRSIQRIASIK